MSEAWASEEEHRDRFTNPGEVGSSVPGWREAVILHDPDRVAAGLKQEALDWRWERLGDGCDTWVAEQIVGLAEEVEKLSAALDRNRALTAAVQRDLLALRLGPIIAVHQRLLYGSENVLWQHVGERMGEEWRLAQSAAFGMNGEDFAASCVAALRLYRLAVASIRGLLSDTQRTVVEHALATDRRSRSG